MPIQERVERLRQEAEEELEPSEVISDEEQAFKNLDRYLTFKEETGIIDGLDNLITKEGLKDADISEDFVEDDASGILLVLKWSHKIQGRFEHDDFLLITPSQQGTYRIAVKWYADGFVSVRGEEEEYDSTEQKFDQDLFEEAIARAFLKPKWRSSHTVIYGSQAPLEVSA